MADEADGEQPEAEETDPEDLSGQVFVIKTTINQEENVAKMVESKAEREGAPILAALAPNELRGYLFVEAAERRPLEQITQNIRHAKTLLDSKTDIADIEHFLTPKPAVEGIEEGDIVELSEGPFKGERARVQRIDEKDEEITVELFEAMVPIPVTVRGDHVRVLKKDEEAEDVGAACNRESSGTSWKGSCGFTRESGRPRPQLRPDEPRASLARQLPLGLDARARGTALDREPRVSVIAVSRGSTPDRKYC